MPSHPQYQQLQRKLKDQILTGIYDEGDLLPSEHELSRMHGLNRVTVRHALSLLEQEGYISKHHGKGSVVHLKRNSLGLLSFRGFSEVVGRSAHSVQTQTLAGPEQMPWPEPFFYELSPREKEAGCIYMQRLRFADADAVMLEHTYLPQLDIPELQLEKLIHDSLFRTLRERHGIMILGLEQDVRAISAGAAEATHLKIHQGSPLLHIYRKYSTNRDGFFVYSSLFCNTEKYAMGSSIV